MGIENVNLSEEEKQTLNDLLNKITNGRPVALFAQATSEEAHNLIEALKANVDSFIEFNGKYSDDLPDSVTDLQIIDLLYRTMRPYISSYDQIPGWVAAAITLLQADVDLRDHIMAKQFGSEAGDMLNKLLKAAKEGRGADEADVSGLDQAYKG